MLGPGNQALQLYLGSKALKNHPAQQQQQQQQQQYQSDVQIVADDEFEQWLCWELEKLKLPCAWLQAGS